MFALNGTYIIFRFSVFIHIFAMFCLWLQQQHEEKCVFVFSPIVLFQYMGVFQIFYSSWIAVAGLWVVIFVGILLVNDVWM